MVILNIGFTGTQTGMTPRQYETVRYLLSYQPFYALHGDCIGADAQFDELSRRSNKCQGVVIFPPKISLKRAFCKVREGVDYIFEPQDYLVRNRAIVSHAHAMIATPKEDHQVLRSGTWATIREARSNHKPLAVVLPNGWAFYEDWPSNYFCAA